MTIFIDTNVLPRSFSLTDGDFELLKAIADELGEQLAISVVVWEESVAQCEREARRAFEDLDAAVKSARTFHALTSPGHPSPQTVAAKWRDELAAAFHIEPLDPADAQEALRREAWRTPPAREAGKQKYGVGARDAALWLTAKRRHLATDGARTFFVSKNTRDFADESAAELRAPLAAELGTSVSTFHYCSSTEALLERTGQPTGPPEDFLTLTTASPEIHEELSRWIQAVPQPGSLRTGSGGMVIPGSTPAVSVIYEVEILSASDVRAFEIAGRSVVFAWLMCRFLYELEYSGMWSGAFEVETVSQLRISVRRGPEDLLVDPTVTTWRDSSTTITRNRSVFGAFSVDWSGQSSFNLGPDDGS